MSILDYLEDRGVDYKSGPAKNIAAGWIGVQCVFPGCADPSKHCGINAGEDKFNCFVCEASGSLIDLIMEIEDCSYSKAKGISKEFSFDTDDSNRIAPKVAVNLARVQTKTFDYPDDIVMTDKPKSMHLKYLRGRGFNPRYLWKTYQLKATSYLGSRFKFRIIIPVFYNKRMVTFTSRDITGRSELKYQHLQDSESLVSIKSLLYNYDTVRHTAIIVEGVMDAWKIGDGAVAIFGVTMTDEQILRLIEKGVENIYILLDSEASAAARRLKNRLASVFPYIEVISLNRGDPASSLTRTNVNYLRRLINA